MGEVSRARHDVSLERLSPQVTTRLCRSFNEGATRRWFNLCLRKFWSLNQRDG